MALRTNDAQLHDLSVEERQVLACLNGVLDKIDTLGWKIDLKLKRRSEVEI